MISIINNNTTYNYSHYASRPKWLMWANSQQVNKQKHEKRTDSRPLLLQEQKARDCLFKTGELLCWSSDLSFLNLRAYFSNILKALHICRFAARNNKTILFVNGGYCIDGSPALLNQWLNESCQRQAIPRKLNNIFKTSFKKPSSSISHLAFAFAKAKNRQGKNIGHQGSTEDDATCAHSDLYLFGNQILNTKKRFLGLQKFLNLSSLRQGKNKTFVGGSTPLEQNQGPVFPGSFALAKARAKKKPYKQLEKKVEDRIYYNSARDVGHFWKTGLKKTGPNGTIKIWMAEARVLSQQSTQGLCAPRGGFFTNPKTSFNAMQNAFNTGLCSRRDQLYLENSSKISRTILEPFNLSSAPLCSNTIKLDEGNPFGLEPLVKQFCCKSKGRGNAAGNQFQDLADLRRENGGQKENVLLVNRAKFLSTLLNAADLTRLNRWAQRRYNPRYLGLSLNIAGWFEQNRTKSTRKQYGFFGNPLAWRSGNQNFRSLYYRSNGDHLNKRTAITLGGIGLLGPFGGKKAIRLSKSNVGFYAPAESSLDSERIKVIPRNWEVRDKLFFSKKGLQYPGVFGTSVKSLELIKKTLSPFRNNQETKREYRREPSVRYRNHYNAVITLNQYKQYGMFAKTAFLGNRLADVIFFLNPEKNQNLVNQANSLKIPSIGIISGDLSIKQKRQSSGNYSLSDSVYYPIIGNSASPFFIRTLVGIFARMLSVSSKREFFKQQVI